MYIIYSYIIITMVTAMDFSFRQLQVPGDYLNFPMIFIQKFEEIVANTEAKIKKSVRPDPINEFDFHMVTLTGIKLYNVEQPSHFTSTPAAFLAWASYKFVTSLSQAVLSTSFPNLHWYFAPISTH